MTTDDPRSEAARIAAGLSRHMAERPGPYLRTRRPPPGAVPVSRSPVSSPAPIRSAAGAASLEPAPSLDPRRPPPPADDGFWNWLDTPLPSAEKLTRLQEQIGDCRRCPLGATRIQLAFGVGNPEARVLFVGEGPGYAEDRKGEPFVGPAGKLLDKILAATDLSRHPVTPAWKWVYIANMVKCHPLIDPTDNAKRGNDRPPTPEEMAVCSPFLMAQIRILRPLFIVTLGATAGKALLGTPDGISKFRGRWVDYSPGGDPALRVRLMPTYHPAALLRNPNLKKDVWEDMKAVKAELEKTVAGGG